MMYFVYCIDRVGSAALRDELVEAHWAYMDGFADRLYARGPTLTDDLETATGSIHVVELPSDDAAREFAESEPNWRGGVYAAMTVCRFEDLLGRSMWAFPGPAGPRFLVIADGADPVLPDDRGDVIVLGRLRRLADDGVIGLVACVQAGTAEAAVSMFPGAGSGTIAASPWRFGGRPGA
ncbi:hypothetical protein Dvina_35130 [Dactylosporangium vinaceum]|uniref:YciI family protein n=1 Tax=Dactylosporangium vinaceum TaxID=53362 RepID=A0ABV5M450_9ACTN|nr:YciI family protein [Dactylosporangium vinaceum]UAB93462.1 hypothetical protein Dvina_35130 [Dactylosporangium vinaceum]